MQEHKDEIELMDYIQVIWKRKWLIIIPTIFCMIVAGVISILLPQIWEVGVVISPSKLQRQTERGEFVDITFVDPKRITKKINQGFYNKLIVNELNFNIGEFSKLGAENIGGTNLIRIYTKEKSVEKAELILDSIFQKLKTELDGIANKEVSRIESQIELSEIEKMSLVEGIQICEKKLEILKPIKNDIQKEIGRIRNRIASLEKEQSLSEKKQSGDEADRVLMLLYSQNLQQSLIYLNTLKESLSLKTIEEEEISKEIRDNQAKIKEIEVMINSLIKEKTEIEFTESVEDLISSPQLISPKKKLNILIAGIFGLMIFTFAAFFLEYVEKQKK